ncbi:class I SAM-dependent methyltransferase [Aphanizomenon flos-aquae]|jgi:SAM-dependent methyltransferase|uniref:Class I SAM-dependent methyltransferase n=1 Tax=Aphanizomenon flos-aquae FACHB-1040 TaxID=2692887 RepID=A0ABR8BXW9_APHFL|nr:class I SAM-dependent methyltransferase [Aphanizomenon flos-aquae]MBD2278542.1 class I SAM-dependent methyltransferase [Aphanizomenon flos-aquae FACHB-1040]
MKMVNRSCPVCGSKDQSKVFAEADCDLNQLDSFAFACRKLLEYMHYRLISCPTCDVLYASPIPELSELATAYHEPAFDSSEEAHYASRTYASFLPEIMQHIPNLDGAIDIGTGDGAFLEELLRTGFTSVIGVEPEPFQAPILAAKEEIQPLIKHGLFRVEDFQAGTFSLITCFQTLEHLYDPKQMCQDAYTLIKKGGAVFFICHNHRALSAKILRMRSPIFDIEHLQLFSEKSARYLLKMNGFTTITTKVIFNRYPLHYWVKLFPLPLKLKRFCLSFLKKTKIGYLPVSIPAGNLAVIGYKK